MVVFLFIIFCSDFYKLFSILATRSEESNTDIPLDLSNKGKKRDWKGQESPNHKSDMAKLKRNCLNRLESLNHNNHMNNSNSTSTNSANSTINLFYCDILKRYQKKFFETAKNIKVTDDLFTYKINDYTFTISLTSLMKDKIITTNKTIDSLDELTIENFIDCFTSVFCEFVSNGSKGTFTVKAEFQFLELVSPEFLPFIHFINQCKNKFEMQVYKLDFMVKALIFNAVLSEWVYKYFKIFDSGFISENIGTKKLEFLLKNLDVNQKLHFSKLKHLLVDLLEVINADKNLIKNYKFLVMLYDYNIIHKNYSFRLEIIFFIYFIVNSGTESEEFLKRFDKYNHILDTTFLTPEDMRNAFEYHQELGVLNITKSLLYEYDEMLKIMNIPRLNIQDHLQGFLSFDNTRFTSKYIYYDLNKENKKYGRRVYFLELWKLLYLHFLRHALMG